MFKYISIAGIIGFLFVVSIFGVSFLSPKKSTKTVSVKQATIAPLQYPLIDPRLHYEYVSFTESNKQGLQVQLKNTIAQIKKEEFVTAFGIYFFDLTNNFAIGVYDDRPFVPASLNKVATAMIYYKKAENNPELLEKRITIEETFMNQHTQLYPPEKPVVFGKEYTVAELIFHNLVYSDNSASIALATDMEPKEYQMLFTQMQIPVTDEEVASGTYVIAAKEYSQYFLQLYNATYLSRESSQKLLEVLSQTTFSQGLTNQLPSDVPVAHKFGEVKLESYYELHDCGIIYKPQHPYLLCVMTRGKDPKKLPRAISTLSKAVYDSVDIR